MQRGYTDVMVAALRNAGAAVPSGLGPPAVLPDAVVLRAYPPPWIWWLVVPFLALAAGALFGHAYAVVPVLILLPFIGIGSIHLVLGTTRCAFDGPRVARRDNDQQEAVEGLRFVPLPAPRGFLSPGFERLLARYVDPAKVILGPIAAERLGSDEG